MESFFEDEFGELPIRIVGRLRESGDSTDRVQVTLMCPDAIPVHLRIQELQHFLTVFPLFDPQLNTKHDGLSSFVSSAPPEPWETE